MRQCNLRRLAHAVVWMATCCSLAAIGRAAEAQSAKQRIDFSGSHSQTIELNDGETIEISVGVESPSKLPVNGRIAAEWIAPVPNAGFRKILHALDPDVYIVYRAP